MATIIAIRDDSTRRVAECALWGLAANRMGGLAFGDDLASVVELSRDEPCADLSEIEETIDFLAAVRDGAREIRAGAGRIELPCSVEEFVAEVEAGIEGLEDVTLFEVAADTRERVITDHDAAVRLLADLNPAVVA